MSTLIRDQQVWMGGRHLSGAMTSLSHEYAAEAKENTRFNDQSRSFTGGLKTVAAAFSGQFEGDVDAALFEKIGIAGEPFSYAAETAQAGDVAYSFLATLGTYAPGASVGDVLEFDAAAAAAGDLVRGRLAENGVRTATGVGAGLQLGAIAAGQKLFAALHVHAVEGDAPTLDVTIESDAANAFAGAETQRQVFDQVTGTGSQWIELEGPQADTWWRPVFTIGGVNPSFGAALILAIQ